jgi:hypothetical protein
MEFILAQIPRGEAKPGGSAPLYRRTGRNSVVAGGFGRVKRARAVEDAGKTRARCRFCLPPLPFGPVPR